MSQNVTNRTAHIGKSISQSRQRKLFKKLRKIYKKVPQTVCKRRALCCRTIPPSFFIEYLCMYQFITIYLKEKHKEIIRHSMEYLFLNIVDSEMHCPFLERNNCILYDVRPFSCRTYGVQTREAHIRNLEKGRKNREVLIEYWKKYDIEVLWTDIEYCPYAKPVVGQKISFQFLSNLWNQIGQLDCNFFSPDVVAQKSTYWEFPFELFRTIFGGYNMAVEHKPKVVKEYLAEGKSPTLERLMTEAMQYEFRLK